MTAFVRRPEISCVLCLFLPLAESERGLRFQQRSMLGDRGLGGEWQEVLDDGVLTMVLKTM